MIENRTTCGLPVLLEFRSIKIAQILIKIAVCWATTERILIAIVDLLRKLRFHAATL